jgi:phospholipid-transporting ATPase
LDDLQRMYAEIECEAPNRSVNEFTGVLKMIGGEVFPLGITQFLLRGARLKNTKWVYGVAVYTGHETRLLQNSTAAPLKSSRVDKLTNHRIIILFIKLLLLSFISAIGAEIFNRVLLVHAFYLGDFMTSTNFLWNWLTFFILYNNLIPISLQVTLELVRFYQALFINEDIKMYDEENDVRASARTSNLNEELGQVKFLMTGFLIESGNK